MNNKFVVKNRCGEEDTVYAHFELYSVNDWQGRPGYGVAIRFSDQKGFPYADGTVSFGELISIKGSAYMNVHNSSELVKALTDRGVAIATLWTHKSGFCEYPLYIFDPDWLKSLDPLNWGLYSDRHDELMLDFYGGDEDEEDEENEGVELHAFIPTEYGGYTLDSLLKIIFTRWVDGLRERGLVKTAYDTGVVYQTEDGLKTEWLAMFEHNMWSDEVAMRDMLNDYEFEAWKILTGYARDGRVTVYRHI